MDGQERRVGAIHEAEGYLARVRADLAESATNVECIVPYGHPAECIALDEPGTALALGYLERLRDETAARYAGVPIATHVPSAQDAPGGIDRFLAETQPALVVMATHGRTGVRRTMMGSVAGHVLRHDATPLVVVRPAMVEQPATSLERAATSVGG